MLKEIKERHEKDGKHLSDYSCIEAGLQLRITHQDRAYLLDRIHTLMGMCALVKGKDELFDAMFADFLKKFESEGGE